MAGSTCGWVPWVHRGVCAGRWVNHARRPEPQLPPIRRSPPRISIQYGCHLGKAMTLTLVSLITPSLEHKC